MKGKIGIILALFFFLLINNATAQWKTWNWPSFQLKYLVDWTYKFPDPPSQTKVRFTSATKDSSGFITLGIYDSPNHDSLSLKDYTEKYMAKESDGNNADSLMMKIISVNELSNKKGAYFLVESVIKYDSKKLHQSVYVYKKDVRVFCLAFAYPISYEKHWQPIIQKIADSFKIK